MNAWDNTLFISKVFLFNFILNKVIAGSVFLFFEFCLLLLINTHDFFFFLVFWINIEILPSPIHFAASKLLAWFYVIRIFIRKILFRSEFSLSSMFLKSLINRRSIRQRNLRDCIVFDRLIRFLIFYTTRQFFLLLFWLGLCLTFFWFLWNWS